MGQRDRNDRGRLMTHRTTKLGALLLPPLALLACEAGPGVEAGLDDVPVLAVASDMRLGSFDDPTVGFTSVSDLDVGADGRIYVLERSQQEIRVFGPDGALERVMGGEGEGPGEFRGAFSFGVEGDTVWVIDLRLDRITLFDRAGELLSTARIEPVRVPAPECSGYVGPVGMRPDGLFTSELNRIACSRDEPDSGVGEGDSIPYPRVLFSPEGAVVDTLSWEPRPPPRMIPPPDAPTTPFETITVGSERYRVPTPPSVLPRWYPLHDGRVVVHAPRAESSEEGAVTVTRTGLGGDTMYHRVLRYTPVPYTDADLDASAEEAARSGSGFVAFSGGAPVRPERSEADVRRAAVRLRAEMDFPEHRPPIETSWVGPDGSVWLLRRQADAAEAAPHRWVVLRPDGATRGQVELPPDSRPLWARGDTFWAVERDDFDVPWLVRYGFER